MIALAMAMVIMRNVVMLIQPDGKKMSIKSAQIKVFLLYFEPEKVEKSSFFKNDQKMQKNALKIHYFFQVYYSWRY